MLELFGISIFNGLFIQNSLRQLNIQNSLEILLEMSESDNISIFNLPYLYNVQWL